MNIRISSAGAGSTGLQPLEQQSAPLRRRIIASLRNAIEIGHLAPGARLIEKDLCEQLNVSRTSLREALRELHAEGILEYTSNRSLAVTGISRRDAENVYRIRAVVESLLTEQFIERANDEMLRLLVKDAEILKDAYRSGNLQSMLAAKRVFYDRLSSGAENPIAFDILGRLVLLTSSLRARSLLRSERQKQSIKEISRLVAAIQRRDVEAARKAVTEHVQHSASSALRAI
jgi:DNA-binding GntR family transcriptional regulator